ncbi:MULTISPECIES: hypothetical protein [unclassified Haloferax]|jgi:hypothetical protein|uniref:hypothetical protein n=1 Tax=unclassified Haloferax TaxID=2625095 RepID=UPI002876E731|nr:MULTISPECIES: hypothetical protein [unclassified Haloferax]MDS0243137.1 hypothetical protein [Haloferax sp. S2CR25]MDS0446258.1 hypothetical protein [Haloferax sp. S2CR25-2]
MTQEIEIRSDIEPARPLEWDLRGGRLFIRTTDGELENVFVDKSQRVTKEQAREILREEFGYDPEAIITPELFEELPTNLESNDDYESFVESLVDALHSVDVIEAKHTTIGGDGRVWTSTDNIGRKGLVLVVLTNIDEERNRPRSDNVLSQLTSTIPDAVKNVHTQLEAGDTAAFDALGDLVRAIGDADSHALLAIRAPQAGAGIPTGSHYYEGIDAEFIYIPESLFDEPLDEPQAISPIRDALFRERVGDENGVRVKPRVPVELLDAASNLAGSLNEHLQDVAPKVSQNMLIQLAICVVMDAPNAVRLDSDVDKALQEATDESLTLTTAYVPDDLYGRFYNYVEDAGLREPELIRLGLAAVVRVLADELGAETWEPTKDAPADVNAVRVAIENTGMLHDLEA